MASEPVRPRSWLRLWFLLEDRVDRRAYALTGFGLMVFKYLVELAFVRATTGRFWTPLEYFDPFFGHRIVAFEGQPDWIVWALAAWTVPFVWIGVSMTVRRAVDAGASPWIAMLFFLPGLNYALMLILALRPSTSAAVAWGRRQEEAAGPLPTPLQRGFAAAALAAGGGVVLVLLSVFGFRTYSGALFLGAPLLLGAFAGFLFNRPREETVRATLLVTIASLFLFMGLIVLLALEGLVCLAMAFPIAFVLALMGALLGRSIAIQTSAPPAHAGIALLLLPALFGLERWRPEVVRSAVTTTVEIDAPPEVVWRHVIAFAELPPPSRLVFALGIAHPIRATIDGEGVGAVRRCEFSTGAFVEPITAWEPPRRLAFDVAEQPPPMEELSFYSKVNAPHLDGFLRSQRGEFRLTPLPDGRTRLEGTTWYELEMGPGFYWKPYADALIHAIHARVLEHIGRAAEG